MAISLTPFLFPETWLNTKVRLKSQANAEGRVFRSNEYRMHFVLGTIRRIILRQYAVRLPCAVNICKIDGNPRVILTSNFQ
jgi:hypothetical protein